MLNLMEGTITDAERTELVKEAYQQGLETVRFHLDCADALAREANSALTLIMGAGIGALGYSAHLLEEGDVGTTLLAVAAGAVAVHMFILAAILTRQCLSARDVMPATNEPNNLIVDGYSWAEIREEDAKNLNVRIQFNRTRNLGVGKWLNKIRYCAFAAPVTFSVAWWVAALAA